MSFTPEGNPNTFVDKKTTGSENKSNDWKIFSKHPRAEEIAYDLRNIPEHWALTPVRGKKPYRKDWQLEQPIDRESLSNWITQGQESTSKKTGKPYTTYDSGYGVRLGDLSGGLLAIDVDGASAEPILDLICPDLPETVSWSSGKEGRRQLIFRIPEKRRDKFSGFTRVTTRKHWWGDYCFECDENELLEFRYNRCQSVLPPSHHPDTGKYSWINSPENTEVAEVPLKILAYILDLARKEAKETEEAERRKVERAQRLERKKAERLKNPSLSTAGSLSDILNLDVLPKLDTEDIYNWNGHNFKREGKKLVGYCPQHGGTSGTAFQVNPEDGSWYCHGCQEGGGAVQYRHFVNGGHGTPRGSDFVDIVKELADDAGVTLPEPKGSSKKTERTETVAVDPDIAKIQQRLNTCSLKPDILLDCNRPPDDLFDKIPLNKMTVLDAYKGWGKSKTVINPYVDKLKRAGEKALCLTSRIILGLELSEKIGATYQTDLPQSRVALKNHPISVVVYDSLLKHLQEYNYIIIDEARAGLKHLVTANTAVKLNRPRILLELEKILRNTPCLLADADISDVEVDYFKELTGLEAFYIKNEALPPRKELNLISGGKKERELITKELDNDCRTLARTLLDAIEAVKAAKPGLQEGTDAFKQELWDYLSALNVQPLVITSDSQKELEAIFNSLFGKYPVLEKYSTRLDAKTTEESWAKELIKDLDGGIKKGCIVLWGWSPSLMVGVSQEMEWFKKGYFFYFGTIEPCEFRQQMARSRPCSEWVGWAAQSNSLSIGLSSSFDPNERKSVYIRNCQDTVGRADLQHLALDIVRERCTTDGSQISVVELGEQISNFFKDEYLNNPHVDLTAKIEARAAYSRSSCGETLKQELETKENFEVSDFTSECESRLPKKIEEEKEAIQEADSELMYQGSLMTEEEASEIAESKQHKHQVKTTGYKIAKGLPGVNLSTDFFLEYVIKNRHWRQEQFLLFLAKHPSVARRLDAESIAAHAYKWLSGVPFLPDLKLSNEKVKLLTELGIVANGSIALEGIEYSKDSEAVKQIHTKAKKLKAKIKSFFNLEVGDDPIKLIGNLLEKVGKRHFGKKAKKGQPRVYQIPTFEAFIKSSPQLIPADSSCDSREKAEAAQQTLTRYTYEAAVQQSLIQRYWDTMADGEKPIFGEFECTTSQPCNTQKSVPLHPCITINKIAPSGANPNPVVADARAVVKQQETEPELTPGNLISDVCPSSTNDEKLKAEREKKYKLLWVDPVSKIKRNVILVGKGDNDDERIVKGIKSHHIFSAKRADCCAYKNGLTEAPLQVGDIVSLSDRKGRFRLSEMIGSAVHIVSELTKQVFKCPINLINKAWNCNSELLWEAV